MKSLNSLIILALVATAAAQSNDAFNRATGLPGTRTSVTGSNTGATKETGEPNHAGNPGGMSVWWSWEPSDSGYVTISTAGSAVDTLLAVYTGDAVNQLTLVAENDDAIGSTSSVTFSTVAYTSYVIAVDGFNDAGNVSHGHIQLSIETGGDGGSDGTFAARNATYNDLITAPDGLAYESSGNFTLKMTDRRNFSARLLIAGQRYSGSGRFDANGAATTMLRGRQSNLRMNLQADQTAEIIKGTVTGDTWSAGVVAERAVFDGRTTTAPQAGTYTLVIPGSEDSSVSPGGSSVGTVTISTSGMIKVKGTMADGSKVTQSTTLSGNGQWPFYAPLYAGNGSVIGWLTVGTAAENALSGPVVWTKLATAKSKNYPDGFVLDTEGIGSTFQASVDNPALNFENGVLTLEGGGLDQPIVEDVTVTSKGQVTSASGNKKMKLKLNSKTGFITGTVRGTTTNSKMNVNAVVLQDLGYAAGFFLNGNQSGNVFLGPAEEPPTP